MLGALVFSGILFYGVLYSGMSTFSGTPVSVLEALRGKISATPKPGPVGGTPTKSPPRGRVGRIGQTPGSVRP